MCAVGIAVFEHISKAEFLAGVRERAAYLSDALLKISNDYGLAGERGEGLLRALLLGKEIGYEIVEKARELSPEGLLLNAARPNLIRFMPALNVSKDEIDLMLTMLRQVLDSLI